MNPDTFKLAGATLLSVHQELDDDEELIFGELYRELVEADPRATWIRRGCGRGIRVGGRGKGLLVRRTSGPAAVAVAEGITQTYVRRGRGSNSSNPVAHDDMNLPLPREPSYDDDGNVISQSEEEDESAFAFSSEESSSNSLDDHSASKEDNKDDLSSQSDSYSLVNHSFF